MASQNIDGPSKSLFLLLPDAHYDVLARIFPGLLLICAYEYPFDPSKIQIGATVACLFFAYFVGSFIDCVSEIVTRDWLQRGPNGIDDRLWSRIRVQKPEDRVIGIKMMGERAFFRNVGLLCVVLPVFWYTSKCCGKNPEPPFNALIANNDPSESLLLLGFGLAVSLLCYTAMGRWIQFKLDLDLKASLSSSAPAQTPKSSSEHEK